jgi:ribosome-binding protein aMBF1 (putative translation factor)
MIQNELQYKVSRAAAENFARALERINSEHAPKMHPIQLKAQRDAIQSELEILRTDLTEYETLRDSGQVTFDLEQILELPAALVRTRIAAGWTQKDLADALGLKVQQVQRYEATEYAAASLERVMRVARVLAGERIERVAQGRGITRPLKPVKRATRAKA